MFHSIVRFVYVNCEFLVWNLYAKEDIDGND